VAELPAEEHRDKAQPAPGAALDRDSPELADHVLKLALAADDSITTLGYVAGTVPAARVDRFVDRRAG
jgi:hypothetical protein